MDRRRVSMCWYSEQERRACTIPNPYCKGHPDSRCTEYVLVSPEELAEVEAKAAIGEAVERFIEQQRALLQPLTNEFRLLNMLIQVVGQAKACFTPLREGETCRN